MLLNLIYEYNFVLDYGSVWHWDHLSLKIMKVASILVEILFPLIYQFIAILFILCYR